MAILGIGGSPRWLGGCSCVDHCTRPNCELRAALVAPFVACNRRGPWHEGGEPGTAIPGALPRASRADRQVAAVVALMAAATSASAGATGQEHPQLFLHVVEPSAAHPAPSAAARDRRCFARAAARCPHHCAALLAQEPQSRSPELGRKARGAARFVGEFDGQRGSPPRLAGRAHREVGARAAGAPIGWRRVVLALGHIAARQLTGRASAVRHDAHTRARHIGSRTRGAPSQISWRLLARERRACSHQRGAGIVSVRRASRRLGDMLCTSLFRVWLLGFGASAVGVPALDAALPANR